MTPAAAPRPAAIDIDTGGSAFYMSAAATAAAPDALTLAPVGSAGSGSDGAGLTRSNSSGSSSSSGSGKGILRGYAPGRGRRTAPPSPERPDDTPSTRRKKRVHFGTTLEPLTAENSDSAALVRMMIAQDVMAE